ncbi:MAG: hypothetical protein MHM6MM_007578 [Cercozoa sp. M6MM]
MLARVLRPPSRRFSRLLVQTVDVGQTNDVSNSFFRRTQQLLSLLKEERDESFLHEYETCCKLLLAEPVKSPTHLMLLASAALCMRDDDRLVEAMSELVQHRDERDQRLLLLTVNATVRMLKRQILELESTKDERFETLERVASLIWQCLAQHTLYHNKGDELRCEVARTIVNRLLSVQRHLQSLKYSSRSKQLRVQTDFLLEQAKLHRKNLEHRVRRSVYVHILDMLWIDLAWLSNKRSLKYNRHLRIAQELQKLRPLLTPERCNKRMHPANFSAVRALLLSMRLVRDNHRPWLGFDHKGMPPPAVEESIPIRIETKSSDE